MNQNEEDYWTTHAAPLETPEKGMTKIYMKCSEARFGLSSVAIYIYNGVWWGGECRTPPHERAVIVIIISKWVRSPNDIC